MKVHINVFTNNLGYSGWDIDLGFTVLPKYQIKRIIAKTMNKWFSKGKNVYAYTLGNNRKEGSHIVRIIFNNNE